MAGVIKQIEQEMVGIEQQVAATGTQLQQFYEQYLIALGKSVGRQFILASYQVCTYHYPQKFLHLNQNEREQLQQSLRRAVQVMVEKLITLFQPNPPEEPSEELPNLTLGLTQETSQEFRPTPLQLDDHQSNLMNRLLTSLRKRESSSSNPETSFHADGNTSSHGANDDLEKDTNSPSTFDGNTMEMSILAALKNSIAELDRQPQPLTSNEDEDEDDALQEKEQFHSSQAIASILKPGNFTPTPMKISPIPPEVTHPQDIIQWQETVESAIAKLLNQLSLMGNRILWQADVITHQFPERLLAIATKTEAATEVVAGSPNLLHIMIEPEGGAANDDSAHRGDPPLRLCLIRLRLGEVEFTDPSTLAWRGKIREGMARLSRLSREYQKLEQKKMIAEAESAWRSTWID